MFSHYPQLLHFKFKLEELKLLSKKKKSHLAEVTPLAFRTKVQDCQMMQFLSILVFAIVILNTYASSDDSDDDSNDIFNNFLTLRRPTVRGRVVMAPGNFDSNTCDPDASNGRYDGGGFYVQNEDGNGIFVCPETASLVSSISFGDIVQVTGNLTTDSVNILTIIATSIELIDGDQEEIIDKLSFDEFSVCPFGNLVKIEGFVTEIVVTFDGYGSIFTIKDCDGTVIKGWWTTSIDDSVTAEQVFDINSVPSYFEMIGFCENHYTICSEQPNDLEFQPRIRDEIVKINPAPCDPPM